MSVRFLCVGDLDIDLMVSVSRMPHGDDKVAGRRIGRTVGGMAANVAVGLRRLGAEARLVAAVGDDENGAVAERAMAREGVDTRFLARQSGDTFMCIVLLGPDGEKSLIRLETDAYLPKPEDVPDAAFAEAQHLHLTFGSEDLARRCITRARSSGASVSLDLEKADLPKDPSSLVELLPRIDWLFVNQRTRDHLERLVGPRVLDGAPCVITMDGAAGCRLQRGDRRTDVPGHEVPVFDTTGAGDGLVAAFLYGHLAADLPEPEALRRANAAAALVVQHFGAQTGLPTNDEIDRFLRDRSAVPRGPRRASQNA